MKFYSKKINYRKIHLGTYQAEVEERLWNGLDVLACATYDLLLKHALEHHGNKALPLTSVADVHLVPKAGLDQVLQKKEKELLSVSLSTYLKLL